LKHAESFAEHIFGHKIESSRRLRYLSRTDALLASIAAMGPTNSGIGLQGDMFYKEYSLKQFIVNDRTMEKPKMKKGHFGSPGHSSVRWIFLLLFLMACGFPAINTVPAISPTFTNRIIVSLTEPHDGESYPISAGLSVRGEAISDGSIARMELWVDGDLYAEYIAPESDLGLRVHYWDWSPKTLGTHTLMIRANDDQNQSAFSNAIHIKGVEDTGYVLIVKVEEGDTILNIAQRYNVSVDDILRENPSLAGASSLPAGTEIVIHIGAPAVTSVPSAGAKVLMELSQRSANRRLSPQSTPTPLLWRRWVRDAPLRFPLPMRPMTSRASISIV
jgi:LysM repeat protein